MQIQEENSLHTNLKATALRRITRPSLRNEIKLNWEGTRIPIHSSHTLEKIQQEAPPSEGPWRSRTNTCTQQQSCRNGDELLPFVLRYSHLMEHLPWVRRNRSSTQAPETHAQGTGDASSPFPSGSAQTGPSPAPCAAPGPILQGISPKRPQRLPTAPGPTAMTRRR